MSTDIFINDEIALLVKESIILTLLLQHHKLYLTKWENTNIPIGKYLPCTQISSESKNQIAEWWIEGNTKINNDDIEYLKELTTNILTLKMPDWQIVDLSGITAVPNF